MSIRDELLELYRIYGLEEAEGTSRTAVFTYSNGYFNNAEIVSFGETKEMKEKLLEDYRLLGYASRIVEFETIKDMHEHLFSGFFSTESSNKKLKQEYTRFCELQTEKLFNSNGLVKGGYEYVEPHYIWGNQRIKCDLVHNIKEQLLANGPQLLIVEAAAGFGKTCASYELINKISEENNKIAPIFTELSKNRKATLFRYVLLDEIDKKFTALSSDLVLYEIRNGRVPLIIDGFDELISRSNKLVDGSRLNENEDAQTMLDTIAELFNHDSNAKIVLTSRKSSIFTGEIFRKWQDEKLNHCSVTRVAIEEPTVEEWIGSEKNEILKYRNIPVTSITNPILLAFLKNMTNEDFSKKCCDIENVIKYYFDSLLEREKERQLLRLEVYEQYDTMTKLAKYLLEFDISSEESSFIKDLFIDINRSNYKDIKERYYLAEERPTEEEFAAKLAGHALLNRVSPNKNEIGFINDFVFGIMITENIMKNKIKITEISNRHIDIACTSATVRSIEIRKQLYNMIQINIARFNYEELLNIDLKLMKTIMHNYDFHYFANMNFSAELSFNNEYSFNNCTFNNCTFNGCIIYTSSFIECKFYDCYFYDITAINNTSRNCNLIFGGCHGFDEFAELASIEIQNKNEKDYEMFILENYWSKGRYLQGKVHQQNILKNLNEDERKRTLITLENLKRDNILFKEGQFWSLNTNKMREVKRKLGNQSE